VWTIVAPSPTQQFLGLAHRALGAIDAGEIGRQVHGDAITELDEIAATGGDDLRHQLVERTRKDLRLVEAEEAAPEDAHLEHAPGAVRLAVQDEQRAVHDDLALVVQRLRELLVLERGKCLVDAIQRNRAHGRTQSS
jgi:hypothetical protein